MSLDIVNENSVCWITIDFKDRNGELQIPISSLYRLDCMATNKVIKSWTNLTLASSVEITILSTDNTIRNKNNLFENKKLTVKAIYGIGDEIVEEFIYQIKNLTFV